MKSPSSQRLIQLALVVTFLAPFLGFLTLLKLHPSLEGQPADALPPPVAMAGDRLTVRWLGAATVYLSDGTTTLVTDGFFSRPPLSEVLFRPLEPDPQRIRAALARAGIDRLDAVIPLHSHYDHMLDSAWLADHLGALLVGSESVANGARGAGLTEALIREVAPGDVLRVGRFELHFAVGAHVPMAPMLERLLGRGEVIRHPFPPPARVTAWRQGRVLSLVIRHPAGNVLVHGSAGFRPGALAGHDVDLALVSAGLLSRQDRRHRDRYFREVVTATGAHTVIPIHWDDLFEPLSADTPPMPYLLDNAPASLAALGRRSRRAGVRMYLLRPLLGVQLAGGRVAGLPSGTGYPMHAQKGNQ